MKSIKNVKTDNSCLSDLATHGIGIIATRQVGKSAELTVALKTPADIRPLIKLGWAPIASTLKIVTIVDAGEMMQISHTEFTPAQHQTVIAKIIAVESV